MQPLLESVEARKERLGDEGAPETGKRPDTLRIVSWLCFQLWILLYHRDYTKQRYFSMERVAADILAIREACCSHVRFVDSTFNINPRRTKEILPLLEGLEAEVSVDVSAEFFDAATINMLALAGIRHVDIGLQSTNRTALTTQPEENAAAADAGIPPLEKGHIPLTVLHKVPLKSSGPSEMAVINWPVFCEDYERLDELILHLRNEHSEKLGEYYHSTREFARAMLREFLL